ncbi:hypothetical protein DFJ58DRAFT_251834 [Suillus subalutaceus]|uniref:uncharacterized protein n=1 Tax=Suillus subalutaceus TaxID=48586 RepID=UPI001B8806DA|nr:uncharacterized protein DFJ58DRAFT_251834 [Suillus subalutaceus]KAG1861608.1 hypothetical protein DFJ58DRAFT_251834 [Suillus subalutaceus]
MFRSASPSSTTLLEHNSVVFPYCRSCTSSSSTIYFSIWSILQMSALFPMLSLLRHRQKLKRKNIDQTSQNLQTRGLPKAPVIIPDTTSAALVDRAPEEADVKEGAVTPELVAPSECSDL